LDNREDFVVVNKPAGMPVHPTKDNLIENVQHCLSKFLGQKLLVSSRLDVPTCGIVIYPKNAAFLQHFNQQLEYRLARKIYRAYCFGSAAAARLKGNVTLRHFLRTGTSPHLRVASRVQHLDAVEAITHIQSANDVAGLIDSSAGTLLRTADCIIPARGQLVAEVRELVIELITGRTHQIRAVLSAEHCPIIGDTQYSDSRSPQQWARDPSAIALQSASLAFSDSRGKRFEYEIAKQW